MKFNVIVSFEGVDFEVVGCYERCAPGRQSGHPDSREPDEPEEFDVEAIYLKDVDIADFLSDRHYHWISNYALQELRSNS